VRLEESERTSKIVEVRSALPLEPSEIPGAISATKIGKQNRGL
jgi:hypothetical protein